MIYLHIFHKWSLNNGLLTGEAVVRLKCSNTIIREGDISNTSTNMSCFLKHVPSISEITAAYESIILALLNEDKIVCRNSRLHFQTTKRRSLAKTLHPIGVAMRAHLLRFHCLEYRALLG